MAKLSIGEQNRKEPEKGARKGDTVSGDSSGGHLCL